MIMQDVFKSIIYHITLKLSRYIEMEKLLRLLTFARYSTFKFTQNNHSLPKKLIVSLTSFPPRFQTAHLTIKTLISQSVRPDKIILWVYENDFQQLPTTITGLRSDLFEIRTTTRDWRSYKKLIPALKAFKENYIVTADDDIYYNHDWLAELIANHDPKIKQLVGHRAHMITYRENQQVNKYLDWRWCIGGMQVGYDVFLTSGGGILFPPNSLPAEAMNDEAFMTYCSTADDIWIHFMARMNGYHFKKIPSHFREFSWRGSQVSALHDVNVGENFNDISIDQMQKQYGMLQAQQVITRQAKASN